MKGVLAGLSLLGAALKGAQLKKTSNGYNPRGGYIDQMTDAYLRAALWSSTDEDGDALDEEYKVSDIAPEAVRKAKHDVERFLRQAGPLLSGIAPDSVGHDLWLTRNGHGTGFWDRGYGPKGDKLTDIAHKFGEQYMYVGDDGKVYLG